MTRSLSKFVRSILFRSRDVATPSKLARASAAVSVHLAEIRFVFSPVQFRGIRVKEYSQNISLYECVRACVIACVGLMAIANAIEIATASTLNHRNTLQYRPQRI